MQDYWLILNIAFLASLSHCVAMCGGIVIALNAKIAKNHQNPIWANFLYNLGRLLSYVVIGALCGGFGVSFELSIRAKNFSALIVGAVIMLMALLMLFAPKILSYIEPSLHKSRFYNRLFTFFYRDIKYQSFFWIGVLNGFLPCGIVYYFALIALSKGGILEGMVVMFVFGICTWIPMMMSGVLAEIMMYRVWIYRLAMILMLIFGAYTSYNGLKGL